MQQSASFACLFSGVMMEQLQQAKKFAHKAAPYCGIVALSLIALGATGLVMYLIWYIGGQASLILPSPEYRALAALGLLLLMGVSMAASFERGREALVWTRDNAAAMLARFGMIALLFSISGMLAFAFLKLDAQFSRPLAGEVIPADVTQAIAWGTRLFTLAAGSLALYFHLNEMPKWRTGAMWLGAIGAVLLMLHAYGISAKIMEGQYANASATTSSESTLVASIDNKISDIDAEIALAAQNRDQALKVAQETIDSVKDQVVGLSAADNATIQGANVAKENALNAYNVAAERLQSEKRALRTEQGEARSSKLVASSMVTTFNPLFTFLARVTTWNFDPAAQPPDGHKYVWGAVFFTLFFGFGELALLFCLTGGFASVVVVSHKKQENKSLNNEQWELWKTYLKRRNAQLKPDADEELDEEGNPRKKSRGGLNFDQELWWQDQIAKAQESAVSVDGIVNYYFQGMTTPEFESQLKHKLKIGWITQEQFDDIMDPNRRDRRIDERKKERIRRQAFDDGKQAKVVGTTDTSEQGAEP